MSAIEDQLLKIKKEAEEREAKRRVSHFDIVTDELEEFSKKLVSFEAVAKEIIAFDSQKSVTGKIFEIILAGGLANRASDIHLESETATTKIRFRVDGLLHDITNLDNFIYKQLLNRIKLLANLKLNIQDRPQDGRVTIHIGNKEVEIRVSTVPSEFGETVVMRVLDPEIIKISLSELGLREDDLKIIQEELKQPNGMILNTGPTGSGKTTTLYAFLQNKQTPELKVITIEDPIEYHLSGVEQTQVNNESNYSFANGLRSMMRQDPDVMLIGEIRDKETAEIAIQAALTGHLVFSTVHTNNAAGSIPRLLDLGVKSGSIGPALNLILAQRLVRRLCDMCKQTEEATAELKNRIDNLLSGLPVRVDRTKYQNLKIFKPSPAENNCKKCGGLGFYGRIAIFELLKVDSSIEGLINKESNELEIQKLALQQGMVTMQQDGFLKFISGITTLEEIELVTGSLAI